MECVKREEEIIATSSQLMTRRKLISLYSSSLNSTTCVSTGLLVSHALTRGWTLPSARTRQ
eukprot:891454-Rhodomonas_salina.3